MTHTSAQDMLAGLTIRTLLPGAMCCRILASDEVQQMCILLCPLHCTYHRSCHL